MKTILLLLAIVAVSSAAQIDPFADRSISSTVVGAIESIRDQMPCGFPGMGIPPLAPLTISHKEVDIDTTVGKLQGSLDDLRLNGLNDFEIAEMKVNAITSKVTFRLIFQNVNVDTLYDLNMVLKKAGFTVNVVGKGPAKFAIKDMHVWGTIKYSFSIISRKLKLKTLEVRTHINDVESDIEGILGEGVVNQKLNAILAEAVEIAVNENEQTITNTIETFALPRVNNALSNIKIGGGKGRSVFGAEEECIPPQA